MQLDPNAHENFADMTRAQTDLLVTALGCGLTRVAHPAALAHRRRRTCSRGSAYPKGTTRCRTWTTATRPASRSSCKAERWIAEQFAYLLAQLDALPEPGGDGTMLDHTLVVWAKELADGRLHDNVSVPFVLAGASWRT